MSRASVEPAGARLRRLAADGRIAAWAGFWWGLAEGLAFFIVPDMWISLATSFSLRAGAGAWGASVGGSLLAVGIIRTITLLPGVDYLAFLGVVPAISQGLIRQVTAGVAADGLPYTAFLVVGGVPLKLYAAAAFSAGVPLGAVLAWTVFARVVRIAPTYLTAAVARVLFRRGIDRRPGAWTVALGLFWVVFYLLYFRRMRGI